MNSKRSHEEKVAYDKGYKERKKIQKLRETPKFDNQVVTVPQSPTKVSTSVDTNQTSPFLPLFTRGNSFLSATSAVLNYPSEDNSAPLQANLTNDEQLIKNIFENSNNMFSLIQRCMVTNSYLRHQLMEKEKLIEHKNQLIAELGQKLHNQNPKMGSSSSAFRSFKR